MAPEPIQGFFPASQHRAWDSVFLDEMRCVGDPPADDAVHAILEANKHAHERQNENAARILLRQLLGGGGLNRLQNFPGTEHLEQFLQEQRHLPEWADRELLEHAQALGRKHLVMGSVLLAVAALPECYLDAEGAPVLSASGQLSEQPSRRLRHTAHMVLSVCAEHAVYPRPGQKPDELPVGIEKALTVRLMHALLRRFTIQGYRLPEAFYQEVEQEVGVGDHFSDGHKPVPINQEDMAYVLLTFSYVVVRGLERLGVQLDERDRDSYVHLWNVIGHIMGVKRELMPEDFTEAASLFHALKQRLGGPSEEGKLLTAAMMEWTNQLVPRPLRRLNLAAELMVYFIGPESAAMLGIEQRGIRWLRHRMFTLPVEGFEALKPQGLSWNPLAAIMEMLAKPMIKRFMAEVTRRPPIVQPGEPAPKPSSGAVTWPQYVIDEVA